MIEEPTTPRSWLSVLCERGGFSSEREARHAAEATLETLGSRLVDDERRALAEELPEDAAQMLLRARYDRDFSPAKLHARIAARLCERQGQAMEQAQVVCAVLAEELSEPLRRRLARHLPDFAELFEARPAPRAPHEPEVVKPPPPRHHDLAEGRPGSRHPVSEARPDNAHQHSVARSDDPHADTKLSTARGLTQEREDETLSTGKPDARRKMSDA